MLALASEYSEEVIVDGREHIILDDAFERFSQLMQEPFIANKKLIKALNKTKPWI